MDVFVGPVPPLGPAGAVPPTPAGPRETPVLAGAGPVRVLETRGELATIAADGTRIAFATTRRLLPADTDDASDVYVRDLTSGQLFLGSPRLGPAAFPAAGSRPASGPRLSADGTVVAFTVTEAPGPDERYRAYVTDLGSGRTTEIAASDRGADLATFDPALSADGTRVAFLAVPAGLRWAGRAHVYVRDLRTGADTLLSRRGITTSAPALSGDGRTVAYVSGRPVRRTDVAGDRPLEATLLVRDLATGQDRRIAGGAYGTPGISSDGARVIFRSSAPGLRDGKPEREAEQIYVLDLRNGEVLRPRLTPERAAEDGRTGTVGLSADGRTAAFVRTGGCRWEDGYRRCQRQVHVWDLASGEVAVASSAADGIGSDEDSESFALSGDGSRILFTSLATNLVPDDPDLALRHPAGCAGYQHGSCWPSNRGPGTYTDVYVKTVNRRG